MLIWCFLIFTQEFVVIVNFWYIFISQGSVETHLLCGEIYNKHIILNCLHRKILKIGQ